jgi:Metal-independent alpha-mannosidase (GH125)/Integrase core domain
MLPNDGYGAPVKPVGLIASGFRPSDDACTFPFLVPSNHFAVTSLGHLAQIAHTVLHDDALANEAAALAERWRVHYNTVRPHSSLGYRPPAPEAWLTATSKGHGEVETATRFPLLHTPDGGYPATSITALH